MSLYRKCWLFTAWSAALLLILFQALPLIQLFFGDFGILLAAALWFGNGALAFILFQCPECELSPFQGSKGFIANYSIFPRRKCGECGHDHRSS